MGISIQSRFLSAVFASLFFTATLCVHLPMAAAEEEKKDDGKLTEEIYIPVPSLAVVMYHKGRPKGNMTVRTTLRLVDGEKRALAAKMMPRLSNAYMLEASRLSHDFFDVYRPVNVALLGDVLQKATNRVLGHKEARILIADVVVNKR